MTTTAPKGIPDSAFIACAREGLNMSDAARKLGLARNTVVRRAERLGLVFQTGKLAGLTPEQQADVTTLVQRGKFLEEEAIRIVIRPKVKVRAPQ